MIILPRLCTLIIVSFFCVGLYAQQSFTLKGKITDNETYEPLEGVNIVVKSLHKGTTTDSYGRYSLNFSTKRKVLVEISYLGYQTVTKEIEIQESTILNVALSISSESLGEVIIQQADETLNLRKPQMSVNTLKSEDIKNIPVVLGESDVIKSLLLLPGVTNAGEASSGFNVRGGSADQNLILLDQANLYSDSHLFGFFSVFNSDAVNNLTLYKGGIPARYGGRASSVLSITQKTGNLEKFHANGGIGVVSSRLLLQGPLKKNKSSFLVAGRSSYAHLFLKLVDNPNSAYFYDVNTKLNFSLDENNGLYFSGYFGRDIFNINESFKNSYGDAVANLHWKHLFSENLTADLHAIYSDYYYGLTIDFIGFNYNSGIRDFALKYKLTHTLSERFKLNYGLQSSYYTFNPGFIEPSRDDSGISTKQLAKKYAFENAVYIDAEHELSDKLNLSYGIRLSSFTRLGQNNIHVYENDTPLLFNQNFQLYEKAPIISSYNSSKGKVIKNFVTPEPRISAAYQFNEKSSVKVSYQRMAQYIQLISNTDAPTPLDVWAPAGKYIQPEIADQFALGYFKKFEQAGLSLETELYYKTIANKIDYINGADLIANDAIEQVILTGEARAYGLELLLRKNTGKLTGWIAYTLSKTEQHIPGRNVNEPGLNNGEWYDAPWDKTHDVSLTANYQLTKKWKFNMAFVFQTGQPVTFPTSQYVYNEQVVPNYNKRNNNRLPNYHHLDLSATLTPKKNANRKWKAEWVFSIYNVYNRKNAASISFGQNEDTGVNEATRLSIFGIIPSVTYNFKF